MNILYCGDSKIRDGVLVSVLSLLANQDECLDIYIATADFATGGKRYRAVDARFARLLNMLVQVERPGSAVTLIDATPELSLNPPTVNVDTRFTPYCMLRLYADQFYELRGVRRLLYLDNDVVCNGRAAAMYEQDMDGAEIGGVLDRYGRYFFHHELRACDYLNSGVLLMDMDRIRETGLLRRCRELCARRRMFMPDQSSLNKLARKKHIFPRRYNEQRRWRRDTVFQHFTTRFTATGTLTVKPWEVERVHDVLNLHAYDDILDRYRQLKPLFIN